MSLLFRRPDGLPYESVRFRFKGLILMGDFWGHEQAKLSFLLHSLLHKNFLWQFAGVNAGEVTSLMVVRGKLRVEFLRGLEFRLEKR